MTDKNVNIKMDLDIIDVLSLWFNEHDRRFRYVSNLVHLFKCSICSNKRIYIRDLQSVVFDNTLTGTVAEIGNPDFFDKIRDFTKHECEKKWKT